MNEPLDQGQLETVYHVTVVSNFCRAFDKYARAYDKASIAESRFADRFYLLRRDELGIGVEKASRLLTKLGLSGDRLLVLQTRQPTAAMRANQATGRGRYVEGTRILVDATHWIDSANGTPVLQEVPIEEAMALSLRVLNPILCEPGALRPRTLSMLPIARACQAACRFCFSESSASLDQRAARADLAGVEAWLQRAAAAGAERFVITGGGEPGLLPHGQLIGLIRAGARSLGKVVLITNGVHLARLAQEDRAARLADYARAGLGVLSLSRHHDDPAANAAIMGLGTQTERVLESAGAASSQLGAMKVRLVCVLQRGGIESGADILRYLTWAAAAGVSEVCFKELYVSTTLESAYHAQPENAWSLAHQVSLAVLGDTLDAAGFRVTARLPWGSPIFAGAVDARPMCVAAYTEPSLYWERANGIARSWNLMADGTCLASLEDPGSVVRPLGAPARRRIVLQPAAAVAAATL